jgi:FAD:protein FMN transferase
MATEFEIRIAEGDPLYARQAAEEAFRRLDHLESLLSRFREESDVSAISRLQCGESVVASPDTFTCLAAALELSNLTGGAFDPGLGAAMDIQRGDAEPGSSPHVEHATRGTLILDPTTRAVTCAKGAVHLDLGAIGKGFAIDQLGELLNEWEIGPALIIAGGSSILALGPAAEGWTIGLTPTTQLKLMVGSVGCSGLTVKGTHILDPRTGLPAQTPARVWVLAAHATVSDALSTAFMVMPNEDVGVVCEQRPDIGAIIQTTEESHDVVRIGRALGAHYGFERLTAR